MNVLLLSRYGQRGASSRLRAYQFLPYLASQGIHVTAAPLLSDAYLEDLHEGRARSWSSIANAYIARLVTLLRAARRFDLVWIEYEAFPWLPAIAERLLAHLRIPFVVDYDDAIFHRYDLHRRKAVRILLGRKIDVIMRRATLVMVGNDYLGQRARKAGARRIEHVPTVVDLDRYPPGRMRRENTFTVGWIGSWSTEKHLSLVGNVLADFCRANAARVVLVGARRGVLPELPAEIRSWTEATEVTDLLAFDVGIMPLIDEPWERGKCGYKLIQYMACGCPVIASPVGVNRQIVEPGVNGFLPTTAQEWRAALDTLLASRDLRARLGEAGRRKVEGEYCTRVTAPRLAEILRSVASTSGMKR